MHELTDKTHWHEPGGTKKAGFGEFKKKPTPYDAFMEAEGIPVFRGIGISKVQNLPLTPWKRTGGRGHYIQLYGTETKWGCYVVEIPPAGALNLEKHIYEEKIPQLDYRRKCIVAFSLSYLVTSQARLQMR